MYAIEESVQKINGEVVETFQREICDGNTNLEIEAGTTGYKGGCCRNAGGRTYLSLLCLSGDFFFGPIRDDDGNIAGITIACCGDDGLNAIIKALEFAHTAINDQRCDVEKKKKKRQAGVGPVCLSEYGGITHVQYLLC